MTQGFLYLFELDGDPEEALRRMKGMSGTGPIDSTLENFMARFSKTFKPSVAATVLLGELPNSNGMVYTVGKVLMPK
jgi:hypothetical protein